MGLVGVRRGWSKKCVCLSVACEIVCQRNMMVLCLVHAGLCSFETGAFFLEGVPQDWINLRAVCSFASPFILDTASCGKGCSNL